MMDINEYQKAYLPIYEELVISNVLKTEKQKERWQMLIEQSLKHTAESLQTLTDSDVVSGLEILADACCETCKKFNNKVFKNNETIPVIPFLKCERLRSGSNCNCCYAPSVD